MQLLKAFKNGQTSVILRVKLYDSSVTTQAGKTGLTFSSSGLIISVIADNAATPTATYTQAGSTIETVTTLGTYAAPTATKCRFREIDATNHPGMYEIQIADAVFATSNAKMLTLSISGVTNLAQADYEIPLVTGLDPYMAAPGASGGLHINGSNSGTTTYAALTITGTLTISGGAVITNSNSNTSGLSITGNGTGHGVSIISGSGATGNGLNVAANSTNGVGFNAAGVGTGSGMVITGGATGHGISAVGGATSGDGIRGEASTSGHGLTVTGVGTTKHGINATGGSTTSHGISATGGGVGHGILATSGGGATGDGIKAISAATNGNGFNLVGLGTGQGLLSTGGLTGNGAKLVGGGTSGDALITSTTIGHAFNLGCTGTNKHPIAGAVESGYDITQSLQLILSAAAGKCSVSGDTVTFRDVNDSANRIVATTDGIGERTAVTLVVA